mmetsp:Transcript_49155/g.81627  ORF Transcript_49155/g.81627 Transcript_49155/m.81627 type:complete len:545 (+) Transcript_49155:46-1680(+)
MHFIQNVLSSFITVNVLADGAHQRQLARWHSDLQNIRKVRFGKNPVQHEQRRQNHELMASNVLSVFARFLLAMDPVTAFSPSCSPIPNLFFCRQAQSSSLDSSMLLQDPLALCQKHNEAAAVQDWETANAIQAEFLAAGYHYFYHENQTIGIIRKPTGPGLLELANVAHDNSSTETEVMAAADAARDRVKIELSLPRGQRSCNSRACADAAFYFALAGAVDETLFETLADGTYQELLRYQNKDIEKFILVASSMLERHASAGTRTSHPIFDLGKAYLQAAGWDTNRLHYLDTRPLRLLWLHQRQRSRLKETPPVGSPVAPNFSSQGAPIFIDIGCATGLMCLGYADKWPDAHVLGVDIDKALLRYPRGIAKRSGFSDRAQFVWAHGIDAVRWVRQNYSGELAWITLNSPTPYVRNSSNVWLPRSPDAEDFLGNSALIAEISLALQQRGGRFLVQSKNEDVAVHMRAVAEKYGLTAVPGPSLGVLEVSTESSVPITSQRNQLYDGPRAIGSGWLSSNPLGVLSETEAGCEMGGHPVHRCVLEWKH